MFSVDLSTREFDGHVVVALGGELDLADAAGVAAVLVTVAARAPEIIVDLTAPSATRNAVMRDPAAVAPLTGCADDR
jgi:hypothetical protein